MFSWCATIQTYYSVGLYTAAQVGVFESAGWIKAEQAAEIVSENT